MCDSTDCPLSALSLAEIVEGCRDEIARFHRCGSARSYGMELFRRAIIVKDAAAWDAIIELYDGLVRSWCRRSGASEHDDINELVQIVWVKFWQNFTSDKLQRAAQFPQVLIYLKLCSRSAVLDAKRRQAARTKGRWYILSPSPHMPRMTSGGSIFKDTPQVEPLATSRSSIPARC